MRTTRCKRESVPLSCSGRNGRDPNGPVRGEPIPRARGPGSPGFGAPTRARAGPGGPTRPELAKKAGRGARQHLSRFAGIRRTKLNQPTTERIPDRREGVAPSTPSSGDETTSRDAATRRLIDLSHTIEAGMITYKGLPAPMICDYLSREASRGLYAEGTEFHIGRIEMVANTGTYIDAPFHRFADGADMSELELASLADLPGVVGRVAGWERPGGRDARAIGPDVFEPYDVRGRAVLVHTGWAAHWRTDRYFEGHPYLTEGAAVFLRDHGAVLVGIDSYNIDDTADPRRPVHTILLGAGIPIVEHMRGLEQLPDTGFRFSAVPVKVKGLGSFPVRAYAR